MLPIRYETNRGVAVLLLLIAGDTAWLLVDSDDAVSPGYATLSPTDQGREGAFVLRLNRMASEYLGLLLLLAVAFIARAALLRRGPLSGVGELVSIAASGELDEQLPTPAHSWRNCPDEVRDAPLVGTPSDENSTALVSAQPAGVALETPGAPAGVPSTALPRSAPSWLDEAAPTPVVPLARLDQATTPHQVPNSSADPSRVDLKPAASLPLARPEPRAERRTDLALVRAWARKNGYTVADRGRVAAVVLTAYDRAH